MNSQKLKILMVGSGAETSIENMYLRAFKKLGFTNIDFFDSDSPVKDNNSLFAKLWFRFSYTQGVQRKFLKFLGLRKEYYHCIVVFKGMFLKRRVLEEARRMSGRAMWININPDDPFNVNSPGASSRHVVESIPDYDLYCIWSRKIANQLKQYGAQKVFYLPFGYDEDIHVKPLRSMSSYENHIAFIGSWDLEREEILEHLKEFPVRIWGNAWQRLPRHSPLRAKAAMREVFGNELAEITNSSAININLFRPQNYGSHNMRTFEIPSMGGMMISPRSEEQQLFFSEGVEADYYSSLRELRDKLGFYLKHPEIRSRVARAGYQRALRSDYTYRNRAALLLNEIKNNI